ncbi:hormogonium polysaccharide biosynthesis acetyltransferase HpsU [Microcoleus sp. Pol12B5]|uniref:hormogonium polysaccharide biosynthesis acetyltransferase HpsU n=1 Tax=Microcoleus sp. Pol12B5 TaxID=3055396 RepID=UPI002FD4DEC0
MTDYIPNPHQDPEKLIANSPSSQINDRPISDNHANTLTGESLVDLRRYDQSKFDRGKPTWVILVWWFVQGIAFPLTPHPFNRIRSGLLRLFGAKIGRGVIIRPTARFTYPWKIAIGDYSWVGDDVVLYSLDRIAIGKHCVLSQKSYLCTGTHNPHDPAFGLITAPVIINNGVWIAADCFIGPGVEIGANALIGARSSVFKNMPASFVCTGTPCRPRYQREINQSS